MLVLGLDNYPFPLLYQAKDLRFPKVLILVVQVILYSHMTTLQAL